MLHKILFYIDKIILKYLGIDNDEIKPVSVISNDSNTLISTTNSYKRHLIYESLDDFIQLSFNKMSQENKDKLGLALGKSVANNLIISLKAP